MLSLCLPCRLSVLASLSRFTIVALGCCVSQFPLPPLSLHPYSFPLFPFTEVLLTSILFYGVSLIMAFLLFPSLCVCHKRWLGGGWSSETASQSAWESVSQPFSHCVPLTMEFELKWFLFGLFYAISLDVRCVVEVISKMIRITNTQTERHGEPHTHPHGT